MRRDRILPMTSSKGNTGPRSRSELLAELAIDFVHVAIELFEKALETIEHRIQSGLIAGKVGADKVFEFGRATIFGTPKFGNLMQAALAGGDAAIRRTWR